MTARELAEGQWLFMTGQKRGATARESAEAQWSGVTSPASATQDLGAAGSPEQDQKVPGYEMTYSAVEEGAFFGFFVWVAIPVLCALSALVVFGVSTAADFTAHVLHAAHHATPMVVDRMACPIPNTAQYMPCDLIPPQYNFKDI